MLAPARVRSGGPPSEPPCSCFRGSTSRTRGRSTGWRAQRCRAHMIPSKLAMASADHTRERSNRRSQSAQRAARLRSAANSASASSWRLYALFFHAEAWLVGQGRGPTRHQHGADQPPVDLAVTTKRLSERARGARDAHGSARESSGSELRVADPRRDLRRLALRARTLGERRLSTEWTTWTFRRYHRARPGDDAPSSEKHETTTDGTSSIGDRNPRFDAVGL